MEALHLLGSGFGFLEITHHAYPDRVPIEPFVFDMAAIELPSPSVADLNHPIFGSLAISNDKMIGKSIGHASS